LTRTQELVACFSLGIGLRHVMVIILSMVFMISCFSLVLQDRILPPVFKQRTSYYWRVMKRKLDFSMDVRQDKIWYRSKNVIFNLKSFDPKTQIIHGMTVYTFNDQFKFVQVLDAEQARHDDSGWTLLSGTETSLDGKSGFPETRKF